MAVLSTDVPETGSRIRRGAEVSGGGPACSKRGAEQAVGLQTYSVLLIAFNPHHSHGFS